MIPKVSVIVPVYNVESFLPECLDSAINQSLRNIEIICVNDGSKDDSLAILKQYASKDDRIIIIDKENAGYGAGMNDGLRAATGEYVAFLESDDAIDLHAYERLSMLADAHDVDIIKGNYFYMYGTGDERTLEEKVLTADKSRYGRVFRPLDTNWSFYIPMMNCLGLFRRSLLVRNRILHNETPGAAHQDMGFWFQTLCCAESMFLVDEPFYMYRQDNVNSSMKDDTTALLTLGEYDYMLDFLKSRPSIMDKALDYYSHRKYGSCMFAYSTSELSLKLPFLRALSCSYVNEQNEGMLSLTRFSEKEKITLDGIMSDPDAYYLETLGQECDISRNALREMSDAMTRLNCAMENQRKEQTKAAAGVGCLMGSEKDKGELPTISVIIPVYNSADYLSECLDSVLNQTFTDFELICINDGSTDSSGEILDSYSSKDSRIIVLTQENNGQGVARNKGLSIAKGRFIQFVDSDDSMTSDALERLHSIMESDHLQVLFFDGKTFVSSRERGSLQSPYPEYSRKRCYGSCVSGGEMLVSMVRDKVYRVSPCMAMFDREYIESNGVRFPEYMIFEDNVFMARALIPASRVGHYNEQLYLRRIREGSTTTSAVTAYHVQSYFRAYVELLRFSQECPMSVEVADALAREMAAILKTARRYLSRLTPVQQEIAFSMSPVNKELFGELMRGGGFTSRQMQRAVESREMQRIYASNSWRIGRAITSGPRWVKRMMKRIKK